MRRVLSLALMLFCATAAHAGNVSWGVPPYTLGGPAAPSFPVYTDTVPNYVWFPFGLSNATMTNTVATFDLGPRGLHATNLPTVASGPAQLSAVGLNGKTNYWYNFEGSDDKFRIGGTTNLNGTTQLTISAWIKVLNAPGTLAPIVEQRGSAVHLFTYHNSTPRYQLFMNGGSYTATNTVTTGTWHHVVATYHNLPGAYDLFFYLDGGLIYSNDAAVASLTVDDYWYIGWDDFDASWLFKGEMDNLKLKSVAVPYSWVTNEFANTHPTNTYEVAP